MTVEVQSRLNANFKIMLPVLESVQTQICLTEVNFSLQLAFLTSLHTLRV